MIILDYAVSRPGEYKRKFVYAYRDSVRWGLHIHRHIEIVLVLAGELSMQIGDEICVIPEGYAVFADRYEPHSFLSDKENRALIIEFSPEQLPIFSEWIYEHRPMTRTVRVESIVRDLLFALLIEKDEGRVDFSEAHILAALAPLCNSIIEGGEWVREAERYNDLFIKALTYISDNFDKPITRESVARELGVRPETVSRIFSRQSRTTFLEYVQRIRIYEATRFLECGASVTEAALRSGFESIRSFNRVFRSVMQKTPTEYLRLL